MKKKLLKRIGLVLLQLTSIMVVGSFVGCATADALITIEKEAGAADRLEVFVANDTDVTVLDAKGKPIPAVPGSFITINTGNTIRIKIDRIANIRVRLTAEPVPLVPVTIDIINRVRNERKSLEDFQYYISERIDLNLSNWRNFLEINNKGEGIFTKTYVPIQVPIEKTTLMVYKNWENSRDDSHNYFDVYFDRDNKNTLRFMENKDGTYGLVGITYGDTRYLWDMGYPRILLIRYREETIQKPISIQPPTGRDITKEPR
jgi:hypothetical protein